MGQWRLPAASDGRQQRGATEPLVCRKSTDRQRKEEFPQSHKVLISYTTHDNLRSCHSHMLSHMLDTGHQRK